MGSTAFRQWRAEGHCKFIHGYRLQCKIWFTADELDERNWVFDFGDCKDIKTALEDQFDHTTCVAADDPELQTFQDMSDRNLIQLRIMEDGVGIERTAEWVYNMTSSIVSEKTNNRVKVERVEVWEHEGNSAVYERKHNEVQVKEVETTVQHVEEPVTEEVVQPASNPYDNQKVTSGISNPFAGTSWGD